MYEGRPILKKIKYTNLNNPSLNSQGMKGVFYESNTPVLIRDELRYNYGFKDSLQKTLEEEAYKKQLQANTTRTSFEQPTAVVAPYESQKIRPKKEVLGKVTEIPMENASGPLNYRGFQNIKTKQNHGFDIIKNF